MERLFEITLIIVLSWLFACSVEIQDEANQDVISDLSSITGYYDAEKVTTFYEFIENNHLNDPCINSISLQIFDIINYLDSLNYQLIEEAGGYNHNGRLYNAESAELATSFLKKSEMRSIIKEKIKELKVSAQNDSIPFRDPIISRVSDDLRVLTSFTKENNDRWPVSILGLHNRIMYAKISLIYSETIYFEMLKSHGLCNQKQE